MSSPGFLDPETLRQVLHDLEHTDVDELEVVAGGTRLYIRREPGKRVLVPEVLETVPNAPGAPIVAPLTGVYYSRPMPDQPPFVEVGDTIEVGQTVALIETMKLFNEVTAEVTGEVVEIVAAEGDLVEAGQPILYVQGGEP